MARAGGVMGRNGRLALEIAFWTLAFAALWLFPR